MLSALLGTLRRLPGVAGTVFMDRTGEFVVHDFSNALDESVFAELGPRLDRLRQVLAEGKKPVGHVVLQFSRAQLLVFPAGHALLCVFVSDAAGAAAAREAGKRVAELLSSPLGDRPERVPPRMPSEEDEDEDEEDLDRESSHS